MITDSMKIMVNHINQKQVIDTNCSDTGFCKALCKLNKKILQCYSKQGRIDYVTLKEIQSSDIYKNKLNQLLAVREAYDCLFKLAKAYEFRLIESNLFDFLLRSTELKKETVNKLNALLLEGKFNKAKEVLINALEKGLNDHEGWILYDVYITVSQEVVEQEPYHGMIARKEGTEDYMIYDSASKEFITAQQFVEIYSLDELKEHVEALKREQLQNIEKDGEKDESPRE